MPFHPHPCAPVGMVDPSTTSNFAISTQLVGGSITVRHVKSISVLSLSLSVYGPIRSTHSASQGFWMRSFLRLAIPVFVPLLILTFMTVVDIFLDGISHACPVHYSMEWLCETSCSGMLEVVLVLTYGFMTEKSRKDHGCDITQYMWILHQLHHVLIITNQFADAGG